MIVTSSQSAFLYNSPSASNEDSTDKAQPLSRSRRNIGEPARYWPQNSTIKIAIYECDKDDEYVLAVKKAASEWLPHINLKFEFVSGNEGDVRIAQNPSNDSEGNSAVGTQALDKNPAYPTMELPWDHKHPRFAYIVMHEFGHMLGAHHAHQHPDADIPWDMEKIKRIPGSNKQEAERNLLPLPRSSKYHFMPYDGESVMHYEIDSAFTHRGWAQSESWALSDGDIAWAKKTYPKAISAIS